MGAISSSSSAPQEIHFSFDSHAILQTSIPVPVSFCGGFFSHLNQRLANSHHIAANTHQMPCNFPRNNTFFAPPF